MNESKSELIYPNDTQMNSAIAYGLQYQLGYEDASPKKNDIEQWQKDIVFSQFTGITDVDGKDVYEGDILNIGAERLGFVENLKGENVEYIVIKQGCEYLLKRCDSGFIWGRLAKVYELCWVCKVVGNIYENQK